MTNEIVEPPDVAVPDTALLTLTQIREHYLPVSERTIYRLIDRGLFPAADIRIGTKIRLWKRETVEHWMEQSAGKKVLAP